jgi:hypothetical protein
MELGAVQPDVPAFLQSPSICANQSCWPSISLMLLPVVFYVHVQEELPVDGLLMPAIVSQTRD